MIFKLKVSLAKVVLVKSFWLKKKTLRKDVILEYDQIESTMLEKDIL